MGHPLETFDSFTLKDLSSETFMHSLLSHKKCLTCRRTHDATDYGVPKHRYPFKFFIDKIFFPDLPSTPVKSY